MTKSNIVHQILTEPDIDESKRLSALELVVSSNKGLANAVCYQTSEEVQTLFGPHFHTKEFLPLNFATSPSMVDLLYTLGARLYACHERIGTSTRDKISALDTARDEAILLEIISQANQAGDKNLNWSLNNALWHQVFMDDAMCQKAILLVDNGANPNATLENEPFVFDLIEKYSQIKELGTEISANDLSFYRHIIAAGKLARNVKGDGDDTLVHRLAELPLTGRNAELLDLLISAKIYPDGIDSFNRGYGSRQNYRLAWRTLLTGQGPDNKNPRLTPMHRAIEYGQAGNIEPLIQRGHTVHIAFKERDRYQVTPLHYAIEKLPEAEATEAVKALLPHLSPAQINFCSWNAFPPVDIAIKNGYFDIVVMLANSGAGEYVHNPEGWTHDGLLSVERAAFGRQKEHTSHYMFPKLKEHLLRNGVFQEADFPAPSLDNKRFIRFCRALSQVNTLLGVYDPGHLTRNRSESDWVGFSCALAGMARLTRLMTEDYERDLDMRLDATPRTESTIRGGVLFLGAQTDDLRESYKAFSKKVQALYADTIQELGQKPAQKELDAITAQMVPIVLASLADISCSQYTAQAGSGLALFGPDAFNSRILAQTKGRLAEIYHSVMGK